MIKPMTCDELADTLSEYLDGEMDGATSARLETHASSCAECAALLSDLRRLRTDAATLPVLEPSRDLWAGIAARIETPIVELNNGRVPQVADVRERRRRQLWLGLAAAGLVAVTATVTRQMTARSAAAPAGQATAATSASNVAYRPANQAAYDREIARLRAILNERRPQLDSATIAVVEHNLAVIDEAIAQCTQALGRDPASRFLIESLHDALETKVQLLRTATTLSSRS